MIRGFAQVIRYLSIATAAAGGEMIRTGDSLLCCNMAFKNGVEIVNGSYRT